MVFWSRCSCTTYDKFLSHNHFQEFFCCFWQKEVALDLVILCSLYMQLPVIFMTEQSHALRNLVPFATFKNLEKHPWRSVTYSKVAGQLTTNAPFDMVLQNCLKLAAIYFNSFMTKVLIILKPVHWLGLQINWLVLIWKGPPLLESFGKTFMFF